MLYIFRLLLLLINIDQEIVLNWFGLEDPSTKEFRQAIESGYDFTFSTPNSSTEVSLETFRLIIKGLWEKVQEGLTLADIENVLFLILFIRFVILAIRYNLKTSFFITCIGLLAGYLWYRHLIDLLLMYRSVLLKLPFLHRLGMDVVQLRSLNRQMTVQNLKLGENAHWYNPGQVIYYAFAKGITHIDQQSGLKHYIDPISMIVSKVQEPNKSNIYPLYYNVYHKVIPKIYSICSKFWNQLSGVAAYAVITRIGKRYCPYLIRWHWTFLLILGILEQIIVYFIYRLNYFQSFVLIPKAQLQVGSLSLDEGSIGLQILFVNTLIICTVLAHISLIIFALFHAIWGQYFYIPFIVENVELHVGLRPKSSIYSGGYTSWQDREEKEKNLNRVLPKFWYGWFGRGTSVQSSLIKFINLCRKLLTKVGKKIRKQFRQ